MKQNRLILAFLTLIFVGCQEKTKQQYAVNFNIEGWDSGIVYLEERSEKGWTKFDSLDLSKEKEENNFHTITGSVETPRFCRLTNSTKNRANIGFFIENSTIEITGSVTDNSVTGSITNKDFIEIQGKEKILNGKMKAEYKMYQEAKTEGEKEKIVKNLDALEEEGQNLKSDYVKSHPKSFVSPYLVVSYYYGLSYNEIEEYLNSFDTALQNTPSYKFLSARIVKLKRVAIGQIAPDFTMNSTDDTPVKFSDIYKQNKYTLVDFWASWCGPCRRENPNVVKAYSTFSKKGFSVFGVSLDSNKAAWQKAIEEDQLTWPHVSDLQGWANSAAQTYAVNSIPANFLVDQDGKIVGSNLTEEALQIKLEELLK